MKKKHLIKVKTNRIFINTKPKIITILTQKKNNTSIKKKIQNIFIKKNYSEKNLKNTNFKELIKLQKKNKLILISKSKGKGFCGTIKKHKFKLNKTTHGNSKAHRKPGSIGMCQTPGRIMKGKKMAGKTGNNKIKKKIKIIYFKKNTIIVEGSTPGKKNSKNILKYEK